MLLSKERVAYLFDAYISQKATGQEEQELMEWIYQTHEEGELRDHVQEIWDQSRSDTLVNSVNWDSMYERVINYDNEDAISISPTTKGARVKWLYVAAAAVILVWTSGVYLWLTARHTQNEAKQSVQNTDNGIAAPKGNRAMIVLADGKKISLDSLKAGNLLQQDNVRLVKLADGQIAYQREQNRSTGEAKYNTLYNPKGSRVIDMVLADGSRVWLNAGSSITFPVAFVGRERRVKMEGEGYFEIAHEENMPFKVSKGEVEVQVVGTHFNVNAYSDDDNMNVTLLEGSVRIRNADNTAILKRGQQAHIGADIKVTDNVDIDQVMAWKNGIFSFKKTSLEDMLKQIGRWYDVEVKFEGQIPNRTFGGKFHRSANITEVLKILEESNIRYSISNKTIIIMP